MAVTLPTVAESADIMPAKKYSGDFAERKRKAARAYLARHPKRSKALFRAAHKKRIRKKPVSYEFAAIQTRSRKNGKELDFTLEQLQERMAVMRCEQTGIKLCWEWDNEGPNPWKPSIDRIDSSKGYEWGNIQIVCWIYNCCKSSWPNEVVWEFLLRSLDD